ncbi:Fur family transcriptional regulator [Kineococcus sp. TBRC 1896]|uniref:Fur family transcriptional regulator n=1 Tax=Kineococcus mangrovi TaxID=1660183 RepID=A0ABV4I086_9ACTN
MLSAPADGSPQRTEVLELLRGSTTFLSARAVHRRLRAQGSGIGQSTVYRVVQALARDGLLDVVRAPGREAVYLPCSSSRHHHVRCDACGRAVEVAAPEVQRWAHDVAAEHGFAVSQVVVSLTGRCDRCPLGETPAARPDHRSGVAGPATPDPSCAEPA